MKLTPFYTIRDFLSVITLMNIFDRESFDWTELISVDFNIGIWEGKQRGINNSQLNFD